MGKKNLDTARSDERGGPPQREVVLVFARAPVAGQVKTRLAPDLDAVRIVDLYKCFVTDILNTLSQAGHPVRLCYDPPDSGGIVRDWLGDGIACQAQDGKDLGEKMSNAFASAFASGVGRAILIGTDTPDLPSAIFTSAFSALTDHDAVIGPALDGGYYLIGFRSDTFRPSIFRDIAWSTASVYATTLARLTECNAIVYNLPAWRDIDSLTDLDALALSLVRGDTFAPATAAYLMETGICSVGNSL